MPCQVNYHTPPCEFIPPMSLVFRRLLFANLPYDVLRYDVAIRHRAILSVLYGTLGMTFCWRYGSGKVLQRKEFGSWYDIVLSLWLGEVLQPKALWLKHFPQVIMY